MPIQRMTARKVRVSELMNGKWVKREGMEPSFVITELGEKVSRARLLGTVFGVFLSEDGNFGSITLDDGTDTIRAKTFKTVKPLSDLKPGDLVEVVGKVREYNQEIYIIPEIITPVTDPNMELLRRIELVKKSGDLKSGPPEATPEEQSEAVSFGQGPSGKPAGKGNESSAAGGQPAEKKQDEKEKEKEDDAKLRKEILKVIGSDPEGVEYSVITGKVDALESRIESVLNEILAEGICYEPTPGRVKKI